MGSQVRMVLLASSFGKALDGEPPALVSVYGNCAVNYLMASLKCVARLQPINEKVVIVTNEDNHARIVEWASNPDYCPFGAPAACNIISNGCSASAAGATVSPLADIALAVQAANLSDCYLVVGSLDYLMDPYMNLQKLVEHAIIRGKDTAVFTVPAPGAGLSKQALLELDAAGGLNPRILSISLRGSGESDGLSKPVLAPLIILKKDTVSAISSAAADPAFSGLDACDQIPAFLRVLVDAGKPLYGLEVDLFLDLTTPELVAFADGFVAYCAEAKLSAPNEASASINTSISNLTQSGVDMGVLSRGEKGIESLLQSCSEVKLAYLYFVAAGGDSSKIGMADSIAGSRPLPARFADMSSRRHAAKQQHPVYQTTSNEYGLKKPVQGHAPEVYVGSNQFFSKTFLGGNTKISTMRTAVTYSNVHKALDDF